jgi:hypothetical protein
MSETIRWVEATALYIGAMCLSLFMGMTLRAVGLDVVVDFDSTTRTAHTVLLIGIYARLLLNSHGVPQ